MAECTVYSPCGRYVVQFTSNAQQRRLWLDVRTNTLRPHQSSNVLFPELTSTSVATPTAANTKTLGIVSAHNTNVSAPLISSKSTSTSSLHLVASLSEADVVALTSSAGVRKNFANFAKMLYDALIGRSSCVHFYVETVTEMKERVQRDVDHRQHHENRQQGRLSTSLSSLSPSTSPATVQIMMTEIAGGRAGESFTTAVGEDVANGVVAALNQTNSKTSSSQRITGSCYPNMERIEGEAEGTGRIRAAVGDTVIEFDEDIADEVLEQRFLTLDYDVDFTRAIFPIPLTEPVAEKTPEPNFSNSANTTSAAPASANAVKIATPELEARLRQELRSALERVTSLEDENVKLRKENAALVQLSKQKMHEMQRLCDDFQKRVQGAADAEKLRAKNTELRVQLQEAIEERQAVLRTLERERSQRRLLDSATFATRGSADRQSSTSRTCAGGGSNNSASPRSLSNKRCNPYIRSLSRDSNRGGGNDRNSGSLDRDDRLPYSRRGSRGSFGGRLDRHGQPLLSPTPTPTSRRRVPTRFDTPPGPERHRQTHSVHTSRASSTHSTGSARGGGGDSPAPRDRTGGRHRDVVKPHRSLSNHSSNGNGDRRTPFMPRRGPSLWADTSEHPTPRGSVASSGGSSSSHERLYRATTASSRQRQTPKAYALEELGARRAVFH